MTIISPGRSIRQTKGVEPKGQAPRYYFDTKGRGAPRREDIVRIRLLENSYAITLPMSIILNQLGSTEWSIVPDEEFAESEEHIKAAEDIEYFLDGRYNDNEESWTALQNPMARDILSIGNSVIEKVMPDGKIVKALYVRDAGTFTKNIDEQGRLPPPDSDDPAYYQWQGATMGGLTQHNFDSENIVDHSARQNQYMYTMASATPIPFNRNEIIWTDRDPRTYDPYSRGLVSDAAILAEVALNALLVNRKSFSDSEIPEGLLAIKGAGQEEVTQIIDWWEANVKGKKHKLPILGAHDGLDYIPFRGNMEQLQYLESQQWYIKMIWMLFGLNANEVGDLSEQSGSISSSGSATLQAGVDVWRKTTMPLLDKIEQDMNRQLMPCLEPYIRVGGGLKFRYQVTHPDAEAQMRERQQRDLESDIITINQALDERGEEHVPWGDMPQSLFRKMVEQNPAWVFDNFVDMKNKPEPPDPPAAPGGLFGLQSIPDKPKTDVDKLFQVPMMQKTAEELDEITEQDFNNDKTYFTMAKALAKDTADIIRSGLGETKSVIMDAWPEEKSVSKAPVPAIPIKQILAGLALADKLEERLLSSVAETATEQYQREAADITEELRDRTGDDSIVFEPPEVDEDSFAMRLLRNRAESASIKVEEDVREQIGTVLTSAADGNWSVQKLTDTLDDRIGEISHAKSRLIARTEIMQTQRGATMAIAEQSDIIGGKEWRSTNDKRTREWHRAMNGVVVPKNDKFTVPNGFKDQPNDYPKSAYVVGDDQPFNCRCVQKQVLREDMPTDSKQLCEQYVNIKRRK